MNEERIKELFSNEEYVKGLVELGSYEKASEKLAEDGVEISAEDLKKVVKLLKKKTNGELTDEELEEISGGFFVSAMTAVLGIVGGTAVAGGVGIGLIFAVTGC